MKSRHVTQTDRVNLYTDYGGGRQQHLIEQRWPGFNLVLCIAGSARQFEYQESWS
jgi:hypothetical protein